MDSDDPACKEAGQRARLDYTTYLDPDGLRGARLGIARKLFHLGPRGDKVIETAIAAMKDHGAVLIDPVDVPGRAGLGEAENEVLLYEFKNDLNAYLAGLGPQVRYRTLKDLIEFNEQNKERELPWFGQEIFIKAQEKGPLTEQKYIDALQRCRKLSREEGIDAMMEKHKLDAIVAPSGGPAGKTDLIYGNRGVGGSSTLAAVAGYPNISVPAGNVAGLPVGISFFGRAFSEPILIRIAFSFERATQARKPPRFLPSIG
jgi:amidase